MIRRVVASLATGLLIASLLAGGGAAQAQDSYLDWPYDDYPSIRAIAAGAKADRRRILVGVSGGETCCPDEHLRDGPMSDTLNRERVVTSAERFSRWLVRAPEATLLEARYDAKWPSLLVIDADGRRAGALQLVPSLPGLVNPARVGIFLDRMASAAVTERFRLRIDGGPDEAVDALVEALKAVDGVQRARKRRGAIAVRAGVGALHPEEVERLAAEGGVKLTFLEPVPVTLRPVDEGAADPRERLPAVPGVWAISSEGPLRVWMPPLLLDQETLEGVAKGYRADLVTERFLFRSLPAGNAMSDPAEKVREVPGVLAIAPDLFRGALVVVGREGGIDRAQVIATLEGAGAKLRVEEGAGEKSDAAEPDAPKSDEPKADTPNPPTDESGVKAGKDTEPGSDSEVR